MTHPGRNPSSKGQEQGLVTRVGRSNRSMGRRAEMKNDKELQRAMYSRNSSGSRASTRLRSASRSATAS